MISNGYLPQGFHHLLAEPLHVLVDLHLDKMDTHSKAHLRVYPLHLEVIKIEMVVGVVAITRVATELAVALIKTEVDTTGKTITGITGRNHTGIIGIITKPVPANILLNVVLVVTETIADLYMIGNLLGTRRMRDLTPVFGARRDVELRHLC